MVEKWNEYAANNSPANKEAALQAAAAYQPYYNKGLSEEADEAYEKAQDEADTLVAAVNALEADKAEDIEDAFVGPNALVPVNADALAIADNTNDEVDNYNEKVEELEAAKEKYDLAVALVDAYDAWNKADNNGNPTVTANKLKELWDAAVAAYNAAVAAKVDEAFTDTNGTYFGSKDTSYDDAVNGIKAEIADQPEEAVAELVLGGTRGDGNEKWKVEYENNVLIVGSGYNYSQFGVDNIGTWLVAGDDAVYDTTEGITWEVTTPADAEDYKVLTATFPGLNGGEDKSVDVTVRNATDEQKVAHDKALLAEALEKVDLSKVSAKNVSATNIAAWVEKQITDAYGTLKTWGSAIEVTVTDLVDYRYDPPADGGTATYKATVSITITSNDAEGTIDLGTVSVVVTNAN